MSRTLNLAEGLLSLGRTHQGLGRTREALSILGRLSRLRELPSGVAEETQARLGELQLLRKRFPQARRHFVIALRYDPDNAYYHRRLAQSLSENEKHWERATQHYRRALELDPEELSSLIGLGLLSVKMGLADEGVEHLKRAVALKPADPEVLTQLLRGLRWSGRTEEAKRELQLALFRNGRDRRFRSLWDDWQFRQLRRQQRRDQQKKSTRNEGPVLLPFPSVPSEKVPAARPMTACPADAEPVPVPRLARDTRGFDQRHVQ